MRYKENIIQQQRKQLKTRGARGLFSCSYEVAALFCSPFQEIAPREAVKQAPRQGVALGVAAECGVMTKRRVMSHGLTLRKDNVRPNDDNKEERTKSWAQTEELIPRLISALNNRPSTPTQDSCV